MLKVNDQHKSIFWHIHKNGGSYIKYILDRYYDFKGSYIDYVLDRYYDFDIKWEEIEDNEKVDKVHIVIENEEDFMKHVKKLEEMLETENNKASEFQKKQKIIKEAIDLLKPNIDWKKKKYFIKNDKTKMEELKNNKNLESYEELEINVQDKKIQIILCDIKPWNKYEDEDTGLLGKRIDKYVKQEKKDREENINRVSNSIEIPLEKWKTYFKFCVVRNPYDRAISSYEFLKQRIEDKRLHPTLEKEKCDFHYFFTHEEELNHNGFMHYHAYASQVKNIKDNIHGVKMDYIAKYENLEEELILVLQKMGITEFPHLNLVKNEVKINKTKKKSFDTYFNEETLKIVNEKFKEDFETFGYKTFTNVQELNEHLLELNDENIKNQKRMDLLEKYSYKQEEKLTKNSTFVENFLLEQEKGKFKMRDMK